MAKAPKFMELKIVHGFVNHADGDIIRLEEVAPGVPRDEYWVRRLKDAKIDGCVEVHKAEKKRRKSVDVKVADGGND